MNLDLFGVYVSLVFLCHPDIYFILFTNCQMRSGGFGPILDDDYMEITYNLL